MISEISENVAQDFATLLIRTSREECTIYPFASEKADLHRDRRRDAGRVAQDPRLAELPAGVERPLDPDALELEEELFNLKTRCTQAELLFRWDT